MRPRALALAALVCVTACANDDGAASEADAGAHSEECGGRARPFHEGLVEISSGGYSFEIVELDPDPPILSQSAPGNAWKLRISDEAGAPLSGAAVVLHTFMPDHKHPGPSAAGIETEAGSYTVEELLLPMPALYSITVSAALEGGPAESTTYTLCIDAETG